jgi:hypothetical protein
MACHLMGNRQPTTNKSATRRLRGIARDAANQLAQMSVGWQIVFDGRLLDAPEGGIEIDVIAGESRVNGHPLKLSIADALRDWLIQDLAEKQISLERMASAKVDITYRRTSVGPDQLSASSHIVFDWGEASGSFTNTKPLPRT